MSKRVAVLTGGGDVPGLNMCLKSLVYRIIDLGFIPMGVRKGWEGFINYNPHDPSTFSDHFDHPPPFEIASLPGVLQAAPKDRLRLLMDHQLRPETLQGALGEGSAVNLDAQSHFPAQVEVRPRLGFLIRDPVVGLQ